ncbi:unnamed protein product, partial [marine sediment metagenome]
VSWLPKEEITKEFSHAGFKCLIHKEKSGSLHGYVILLKEHPYHGKGPWDIPENIIAHEDGLIFSTPLPGVDPWRVGIGTHERYHTVDFVVSKIKHLAEQLEKRNKVSTRLKEEYVQEKG